VYLLAQDLDWRQLSDRTRTAFLTRAAVLIELPDDAPAAKAQAHFTSILRDGPAVDEVSSTDAALVALAAAGRVRTVISPAGRRRYGDRISAMTDRLGTTAPGLARAVRGIEMTIVAARDGTG
jgi:uncharacterized glyoxalase superfamily protein PhnB